MCHSIHSDVPRETRRRSCRRGFTLIELLVAIAIIVFLATLGVVLMPRLSEQQRAGRGADQLQGWFLIAKQRALRSGLPTGIRIVDTNPANNNGLINEFQYVEQPPDFQVFLAGTQVRQIAISPNPLTYNPLTPPTDFIAVLQPPATGYPDFSGGFGTDKTLWPVQIGDYLEVQGGGLLHQIIGFDPAGLNDAITLHLAPFTTSLPVNTTTTNIIGPTSTWRIIRSPRVIVGEEPLKLPDSVALFKGFCQIGSGVGGGGGIQDFMFAPSGRLLSPNADPIFLWIGDSTTANSSADSPLANNPVLISIKANTGLIATYPVDTSGSDPYSFARTNRSGGL